MVWSNAEPFSLAAERGDTPERAATATATATATAADRAREILPLLLLALFAAVLVKRAWLTDDAFTSFRAASNLVNGFGLVSNPPERVQAFTNPLWTLVFAVGFWLSKDAYAVAMLMSLTCSLAAVTLVGFARGVDVLSRALGVLALSLSVAFLDFSTSGLENPLSHLLLVLLYTCERRQRDTLVVALLAGLLAFNRLDHLLLVMPVLVARVVRSGPNGFRRELGRLALGFLPLLGWELFALVYYGFPLPNTAYSKLNATLSSLDFFRQGLWYLVECASRDPLTLLLLLAATAAPFVARGRRLAPFALGLALYLGYVVRVGGDFMAGRFLSTPLVLAVLVLFHDVIPALSAGLELAVGAVMALVALAGPQSSLNDASDKACTVPESGVTNERDCYRPFTALVLNVRLAKWKAHEYYQLGLKHRRHAPLVLVEPLGGLESFAAGPRVHVIDEFALTDPLLSRIPFAPATPHWRIGHFIRALPDGYAESIRSGKNRISDPCIARFYDRLKLLIEGPLFSWARFAEIARLNLGNGTVTPCPSAPKR